MRTLIICLLSPQLLIKMYIASVINYIRKELKSDTDFTFYSITDKKDPEEGYDCIIIDATILLRPYRAMYRFDKLFDVVGRYSSARKILLTHDLHDWSFTESVRYDPNNLRPVLDNTEGKRVLRDIVTRLGVTGIIFYYYCTQSLYLKNYLPSVRDWYVLDHSVDTELFRLHTKKNITKKYDVLFYSSKACDAYPVRYRLLEICRKLKLRIMVVDYSKGIRGKQLAMLINESWLTIACTLRYGYAVQKYLEIPSAFSVVLGDANRQVDRMLGDAMIRVDPGDSDDEIAKLIRYYLANPGLLVYLSSIGMRRVHKTHGYNRYADDLRRVVFGDAENLKYDQSMLSSLTEKKKHKYTEIHLGSVIPPGDYVIESEDDIQEDLTGDEYTVNGINYRVVCCTGYKQTQESRVCIYGVTL